MGKPRLILLRHAKSDWYSGALSDHDRPLNGRGMRDAPRVGRWIDANGYTPTVVLCSSALRTRQTLDGVADDWPITYSDLEPFYAENDRVIGVAGLAGDPAYPYHEPPLPPVPLGRSGETMARGLNALGWHWWPADSAIATREYEGRARCLNLGPCQGGCAQGAKSSADVTYWPLAQRQRVELRTGCRVREVTVDERSMATGVTYFDDEGNELPPGEVGTVYFAGDQARFEYHKEEQKTAGAYNERGWATTGDVGYLDEDGFLYLTDRKNFMIISGGVNIYPQETEDCLITHPRVADVAVIGVPNEEFGEEVKAIVEPQDMADAGAEFAEELMYGHLRKDADSD